MTNEFTQKGIYLTEGGVLVKIVSNSCQILSVEGACFNWYQMVIHFYTRTELFPIKT